jgi:FkbM family methyltransferase
MNPVRRLTSTLYAWRWPLGWWRLQRRGTVKLAGRPIVFAEIGGTPNEWWALSARRRGWEQPVLDAFAARLRPGDVVYDVGAWIGPYSLLAGELVGPTGRVVAFEPDPNARRQLERNVALNDATNVRVSPVALSDRNGIARLGGGESEAMVGETGEFEVETMTLPDFVAREGRPDVVKVDIEGGELLLDVDSLAQARHVFLEVHVNAFRDAGVSPDEYLARIAGGRPVTRLEGDEDNFNVLIGE